MRSFSKLSLFIHHYGRGKGPIVIPAFHVSRTRPQKNLWGSNVLILWSSDHLWKSVFCRDIWTSCCGWAGLLAPSCLVWRQRYKQTIPDPSGHSWAAAQKYAHCIIKTANKTMVSEFKTVQASQEPVKTLECQFHSILLPGLLEFHGDRDLTG